MPTVGFGTWQVGRSAIATAAEAGYRGFDTASKYENEREVTQGLTDAGVDRSEVHLTSKVWRDDMGFNSTIRAFDASRRRLRVDVIDLYLIHWPVADEQLLLRTWEALETLQGNGLAKSIGVSNFSTADLDLLERHGCVKPAINQIERHPLKPRRDLLAEHQRRGIATAAWSPIGRGGPLLETPALIAIAEKFDATVAQVALRWAVDAGTIPLPRSADTNRIRENLDLAHIHLSDDDRAQIDALGDSRTMEAHQND